MSKIEWTERTWNPIVGCSVVSPGCTNCYAMAMAARLERMGLERYVGLTRPSKAGPVWTGETRLVEDTLTEPLRRQKPTMWFVNSMSDLFHESVPDAWIDRVFAVMALAPQHTFQVLTKRSARMRAYMDRLASQRKGFSGFPAEKNAAARLHLEAQNLNWFVDSPGDGAYLLSRWPGWPLPNVWLGVSTEDQRRADERVPDLLATPAAVRFVSAEPLLGSIDFTRLFVVNGNGGAGRYNALTGEWRPGDIAAMANHDGPRLDQIIVGGESGSGPRPMHPAWARLIRDQCQGAETKFFFKQWGAWVPEARGGDWMILSADGDLDIPDDRCPDEEAGEVAVTLIGKRAAGRLFDGVEHNGMPAGAGAGL